MRSRPWPWLRDRITALLSRPASIDASGLPAFTTRVQDALYSPPVGNHPTAVHN